MSVLDKLKFWKKEESFGDLPAPPDFNPPQQFTPGEMPKPQSMEQFGMPQPIPGLNEPPQDVGAQQPPFSPQQFSQSSQQPSFPSAQPFQPQAIQQQSQFSQDQQIQLISAKLDTIKAQLETVLQRLDRLDRKDEQHAYQQRWRSAT